MTHDETRDELARMDGWNKPGTLYGFSERGSTTPDDAMLFARDSLRNLWSKTKWWRLKTDDSFECLDTHPHAPTLDGANAAVPEGWTWNRWGCLYRGYHDGAVVKVSDHGRGHEMADMYALALACRRAMEEKR